MHTMRFMLVLAPFVTWVFNVIVTAMVSELPAPTKDSTIKYCYWFRVANRVVGNIARARSTSLEGSPNYQDAMQAHVDRALANLNQPVSGAGARVETVGTDPSTGGGHLG